MKYKMKYDGKDHSVMVRFSEFLLSDPLTELKP